MPDHDPLASLSVRRLLVLSIPALTIGVLSALVLWSLERIAEGLQHLLWEAAPGALGIPEDSPWLIVAILTLTGAAVGLVVRYVPGHGARTPRRRSSTRPRRPCVSCRASPSPRSSVSPAA